VQGIGGAVASAVSLSLMLALFTEPADRAKAMGLFGFVASGGGSIGVVLGGVLTDAINWHWIFLVNLPIGVLVVFLTLRLIPDTSGSAAHGRSLDIGGAITVTLALMVAVYAIVNGNADGWTTSTTLVRFAIAIVLFVSFILIETRVSSPLMPLGLFRRRNLSTASVAGILWAGAMFAWFFLSALYMQLVLGYEPMKVGIAFLPSNLIMAAFSLGLSAKMIMRFGIRLPLFVGLMLAAAGLLLFARAPLDGTLLADVLPGMLLLGLGAGMAFNPVLMAAMSEVGPEDSGLASGVVNTSFMMGGSLGLACLASLAASRTASVLAQGVEHAAALAAGYRVAFLVGALFAALAAIIGGALLRTRDALGQSH
jgi:MFS family permease